MDPQQAQPESSSPVRGSKSPRATARQPLTGYAMSTNPYEVALAGGISSLSIVAILQLLSLNDLDLPLTVALYCFVYVIPIASGAFVALVKTTTVVDPMFRGAQWVFVAVYITAQLAFAGAVTAITTRSTL